MPQATVAAAIVINTEQDSFVLLTKRACEPFKGQFCLPGGHIEKNEHANDAIRREIKEEVGLDIQKNNIEVVGVRDEIYPEKNINNVVTLYLCENFEGEVVANPKEVSEWFWCDYKKACDMNLAFDHQELLKLI